MPLIVNGVCRFRVEGVNQGRAVNNIWDIRVDTTGSTLSRTSAIQQQAARLLKSWNDNILPRVCNEYNALQVGWVDLDEADGSTGSTTTGDGATWPAFGALTTPTLVSNVALLVRKNIPRSRGKRNGRSYINALDEAATAADTPNTLPGAQVTAWNSALSTFRSGVNNDGSAVTGYTSRMCVVHITEYGEDPISGKPVPVAGVSTDISSLTCDALLATQRRRLRK